MRQYDGDKKKNKELAIYVLIYYNLLYLSKKKKITVKFLY